MSFYRTIGPLVLCLYRPVCVGPVQIPNSWFSHEAAHFKEERGFGQNMIKQFYRFTSY